MLICSLLIDPGTSALTQKESFADLAPLVEAVEPAGETPHEKVHRDWSCYFLTLRNYQATHPQGRILKEVA